MRKTRFFVIIPVIAALFLAGCSSSIDTTNFGPDERLGYAMKLYEEEDYDVAVNEFQAITLQYPGNAVVDDAQYYLAMSKFKRGEFIVAAFEFSRLIKNMPASEFVSQAQFMLAECYYELSPNFTLDQKYTKKSIEEYQAFIDFFPTNEKVPDAEKKIKELNDKLAHKAYNTAYIYEKLEYYSAALLYYNNVVELYHDTRYAPMALYNRVLLLVDRNRNEEALTDASKFLQRYPDDNRAGEVEKIKQSLENKLSAAR